VEINHIKKEEANPEPLIVSAKVNSIKDCALKRFPGLKSFLEDGHIQKYEKLKSAVGNFPPALRFYDETGLEIEALEILKTQTVDEIKQVLASRGIFSSK